METCEMAPVHLENSSKSPSAIERLFQIVQTLINHCRMAPGIGGFFQSTIGIRKILPNHPNPYKPLRDGPWGARKCRETVARLSRDCRETVARHSHKVARQSRDIPTMQPVLQALYRAPELQFLCYTLRYTRTDRRTDGQTDRNLSVCPSVRLSVRV